MSEEYKDLGQQELQIRSEAVDVDDDLQSKSGAAAPNCYAALPASVGCVPLKQYDEESPSAEPASRECSSRATEHHYVPVAGPAASTSRLPSLSPLKAPTAATTPASFSTESKSILVNGTLLPSEVLPLSGGRVKKFRCTFPDCDKAYTRPVRLEEHIRSHTGDKPFKCSECSAAFGRDSHLKAHIRTHLDQTEKSLTCEFCEKSFWTNQHLKKHVQTIHKGKTFNCTECDESFRKHHQLRTHAAEIHSTPGTNPFQCEHPDCDKSFKQAVHLKAHAKTHDLSRYLCSHLDCASLELTQRQHPNWSALQKHTKLIHPPTCPFPECDAKTFTSNRGLKNHLAIHEERELLAENVLADGKTPRKRKKFRRKRKIGNRSEDSEETAKETETENDQEIESKTKKIKLEPENLFKCEKENCSRKFKTFDGLQKHEKLVHSDPKPAKVRRTVTMSTASKEPVDDDTNFTPSLLDLVTGYNYSTDAHDQNVTGLRSLACPHPDLVPGMSACSVKFSRVYDAERHLISAHSYDISRQDLQFWYDSNHVTEAVNQGRD